jgi:hypothetical protein
MNHQLALQQTSKRPEEASMRRQQRQKIDTSIDGGRQNRRYCPKRMPSVWMMVVILALGCQFQLDKQQVVAFSAYPSTTSFTSTTNHHHHRRRSLLVRTSAETTAGSGIGEYDPSEGLRPEREVIVGNPQLRVKQREFQVTDILKELSAIQQQGPQRYCILGTRHCSYLHQQIIELL